MKNKIKVKNSFFTLYKNTILLFFKIIGVIFSIAVLLTAIYFYPQELLYIVVSLFVIAIFYNIYVFVIFLFRQRNIPLTKEELEAHNIKSVEDYRRFLCEYLKGFHITNKIIQKMCCKSAFYYLLNDEERLDFLAIVMGKKCRIYDVRYIELMEEEKSITYSILDYKENEIDSMINHGWYKYCPHKIDKTQLYSRFSILGFLLILILFILLTYKLPYFVVLASLGMLLGTAAAFWYCYSGQYIIKSNREWARDNT